MIFGVGCGSAARAAVPRPAGAPVASTAAALARPGRHRARRLDHTDDDPSRLPVRLQQLDTKVIAPTTEKCRVDANGDDSWGIRDHDICTDNPEGVHGPCGGDSGSPLLVRAGDHWMITGVDSRGVGAVCGRTPDIYTSVGHHHRWITGVVR